MDLLDFVIAKWFGVACLGPCFGCCVVDFFECGWRLNLISSGSSGLVCYWFLVCII